jgi:hypothetical protein
MVKFSYDNPDRKIHGGSIRAVQSEFDQFKQKQGLFPENEASAKRKR